MVFSVATRAKVSARYGYIVDVKVEPMVLLTQRRIPVKTMRVLRARENVCGLEGEVGERVRRMRSESESGGGEEGEEISTLQRVDKEDDEEEFDPVAVRTWMVGMVTEGSSFGFSVVSMTGHVAWERCRL